MTTLYKCDRDAKLYSLVSNCHINYTVELLLMYRCTIVAECVPLYYYNEYLYFLFRVEKPKNENTLRLETKNA